MEQRRKVRLCSYLCIFHPHLLAGEVCSLRNLSVLTQLDWWLQCFVKHSLLPGIFSPCWLKNWGICDKMTMPRDWELMHVQLNLIANKPNSSFTQISDSYAESCAWSKRTFWELNVTVEKMNTAHLIVSPAHLEINPTDCSWKLLFRT